jgi:hypothetical protein
MLVIDKRTVYLWYCCYNGKTNLCSLQILFTGVKQVRCQIFCFLLLGVCIQERWHSCQVLTFSWRWGGSSTQAWMPTYVSILRIPQMMWVWRTTVEWYWQGKTEKLGRKTCPSATLSTTNPTWTYSGANPVLRGERPATNHLSHGTARQFLLTFMKVRKPYVMTSVRIAGCLQKSTHETGI